MLQRGYEEMSKKNGDENRDICKELYRPEHIKILPTEKKYVIVMDEVTGDIKSCVPIKNKNLGNGWVAMYQEAMAQIAKEKLTGEQSSVLWYLLAKVDFDNYLMVNQTKMAKELDINRVNISKAIKKLCEREIIVEGPRIGLCKTYRLNPYIAHKGKKRDKTIIEFESYRKTKKDETDK